MPKKKSKRRIAKQAAQTVETFSAERKELKELIQKRDELAQKETREIGEATGFAKVGKFIGGLSRRAALNKQINRRVQLLKGQQTIKRLKQQKEIAQLKKQIAAERPKPLSFEDINKPIEGIKSEDIFKQL